MVPYVNWLCKWRAAVVTGAFFWGSLVMSGLGLGLVLPLCPLGRPLTRFA